MRQTQSPSDAMCDNPFIVHEFFCAREWGTRRREEREQIRIVFIVARKWRSNAVWGFSAAA
jgi:hypothetical protein